MTKKIAVIDPYMVTPSLSCFNRLVDLLGSSLHYHLPQVMGQKTLDESPADAYIVLGSASHVFQKLPWHAPLADFLVKKLNEGRPVLGICFGHQLLCDAFGAKLGFFQPDEFKLTGVRTVEVTQDALGLKTGEKFTLTVAHRQIVTELSAELEEIGRGHDRPMSYDIVRHRTLPFMGVQPHPEAMPCFGEDEAPGNSADLSATAIKDGARLITTFLKHHRMI